MEDGEQEGLRNSLNGDPRFLVAAATVATLFVAGSALWRSSMSSKQAITIDINRKESGLTDPDEKVSEAVPYSEEGSAADGPSKDTRNEELALEEITPLPQEVESKESKSARTKDRRRRGKDPMKEIMKSGKKTKGKASPSGDVAEKTDVMPAMARIPESAPSPRSRKTPMDPSTRTLSASAVSSHRIAHGSATSDHSPEVSQNGQGSGTDDFSCGFTTSSVSELEELSLSLDGLDTPESQNSDLPAKPLEPREILATQASDLHQASSSSPTSHSSSSAASPSSVITPDTSPTISLNEDISTPTLVHPSVSLPADLSTPPIPKAKSQVSSRQLAKAPDPWDWAAPTPSETTYRKPPRFQGKSRGAGTPTPLSFSVAASPPTSPSGVSASASHPSLISPYSAVVASSRSTVVLEEPAAEQPTPLTFPTLNPSTSNPPPSVSPGPNRKRNSSADVSGAGASTSNGNTGTPTRRAPTPRRPPTPSSGTNTPPPSLSAQTQLASLRGALEAARLREEKSKSDMERYLKEMEVLRWENVACRRREVELQTQAHYLMNQLQAYAALFASMPPQPPLNSQMQSPTGGGPTSNGSGSTPNGFPAQNGPLHPHLQMLSSMHMFPLNGNQPPPTLVSPGTPHSGQPSTFFPHPMHSHTSPPQQSQSQPSPHQANLFSMFFPPSAGTSAVAGNGSGPSSAAESSSVGSASPDLNGSPSPTPAMLDRGMIRPRTRTQTANGRIGGMANGWEGADHDGWIGMGEEDKREGGTIDEEVDHDDENDEDDDFNELLADAILKRPGSIRVRKKEGLRSGKERASPTLAENEEHTEFTFPSLSELGNVSPAKRGSVSPTKRNSVENVKAVPADENIVASEECAPASFTEQMTSVPGSPPRPVTDIRPNGSEEDHHPSEQ